MHQGASLQKRIYYNISYNWLNAFKKEQSFDGITGNVLSQAVNYEITVFKRYICANYQVQIMLVEN